MPVASPMPGHMNVLLPGPACLTTRCSVEDINSKFPGPTLPVIGANGVTVGEDPQSPSTVKS
jgi:NAD/NADP transhydrogenase beta subunit